MKLNTVNVIETVDSLPIGIHSFTYDVKGFDEAEKCCRDLAIKNVIEESNIEQDIANGCSNNGSWAIYLVNS